MRFPILFLGALIIAVCSCNNAPIPNEGNVPKVNQLEFELVGHYPHDTTYFTEGLVFVGNVLLEGTGSPQQLPYTKSLICVYDSAKTSNAIRVELDKKLFFGEGITVLNNKVYQLTYQTKKGFVYDRSTFKKLAEFSFPSAEGWGLTTDGKQLIMSDGTDVLTFLDSVSFKPTKSIKVSNNGLPEGYLNELEYINGYIYANVYTTNTIVKINPQNGEVMGTIDLSRLVEDAKNSHAGSLELNGIAYDSVKDELLLTGKCWPRIYRIKVVVG